MRQSLATYIRVQSRAICKESGCKGDTHHCGSVAYFDSDKNLVEICLPDYAIRFYPYFLPLPAFPKSLKDLHDMLERLSDA